MRRKHCNIMIMVDDLAGNYSIILHYSDKSFMQSSNIMIGTVAIRSLLVQYFFFQV